MRFMSGAKTGFKGQFAYCRTGHFRFRWLARSMRLANRPVRSVRSPSGFQFTVAGKVKSPGTFSPGRYINLIEALSYAGGPDEFAGLDSVTIIRKPGNNLVTIRARISGAYKGGAAAREITANSIPQIESGDTVIVP